MKVMFFGLGSMGQRHARLLSGKHELYTYRSGKGTLETPLDVKVLKTWTAIDKAGPKVAFITNPTECHVETAIECATRGMHLFIEKPLSVDMNGVEELKRLEESKNITVYVAYPFRHHPEYIATLDHVKNLWKDQIRGVFVMCHMDASRWPSSRPLNGPLLELSHEIDYCEGLFGEITGISGIYNDTRAALALSHSSGIDSFLSLIMDAKEETRIIEIIVRGGLSRREWVITDDIHITQHEYFFDLIAKRRRGNLETSAKLLRKIVDFRDSRIILANSLNTAQADELVEYAKVKK